LVGRGVRPGDRHLLRLVGYPSVRLFGVEAFNLLNTAHFAAPDLGARDSNFGQLYETDTPRVFQLALKLTF